MAATVNQVHVARQPILDARQQVFGYELLYRATSAADACNEVDVSVSARVIGDALLGIGFDTLTDGRRAFINLDGQTLLADASGLFDPEQVVLEILESVSVTPEVEAMCRSLHNRGYALALDDFVPGSAAEALVPLARFVKLDVLALAPDQLQTTTKRLLAAGVTVVAEKVETAEVFERARTAGCSLFQGYYFCRPATFSGRALPAGHVTQMRLVAALNQPSVSLGAIEDLLKHDASLSYRVLRSVNSAGFGLRREVHSIREALLLLGLDQVRKWSAIWALAGLNRGPTELVTMTVIRARCCELLGQALDRSDQGAAYFLLGLCSLLDVLLGHPMEAVLGELPLDPEIHAALSGETNPARRALDAVIHFEQGRWHDAAAVATSLGLDADTLPDAYADALGWARKLTHGGA
ncbi:MAG: HDOD domain-containing protein [Acidobacteria bacterium]|nr:HDOD domain-containing protein [Acidobacteriota bacterium]